MHEAIYNKLIKVAKAEVTITYSEIAPLANLNMDDPVDRNKIAVILDEISTSEHDEGRPLLSAVVIGKTTNVPGSGFYTMAKRCGVHIGSDNVTFFARELTRVHEYWKSR